jgi:hypothetical protein
MPSPCSHDFIFSIALDGGLIKRACFHCEDEVEPSKDYFFLDEVTDKVWIYRKRYKDSDGNWLN